MKKIKMRVEDAIKILNEHRHRSADDWALNVHGEVAPEGSGVRMDYFTQFEAIAIAVALAERDESASEQKAVKSQAVEQA